MEAVRPSRSLEPSSKQWLGPEGSGVGGEKAVRFHINFEDSASGYGDSFDIACEKKRKVKDVTKVLVPGN